MNRSTRGEPSPRRVQLRTAVTVCALLAWSATLLFAASIATAATGIPECVGDCNHDGRVNVFELIEMVNIALGDQDFSTCTAGDANGDDLIEINEIIWGLNYAVNGCPVLGAGDCCQCADFCAAPVDGTCGGCSVVFGGACVGGSSCVGPTPTPTRRPVNTPTATNTPAASDCCQCPTSCAAPIDGSCGSCTVVLNASCRGGSLCVPSGAAPVSAPSD